MFFTKFLQFSSVQLSCSVVSYSVRFHESQHARPPCPSPTPGVNSNSRPFSRWCHPTITALSSPSPAFGLYQHQGLLPYYDLLIIYVFIFSCAGLLLQCGLFSSCSVLRLSCSKACGIFLDQGSTSRLLLWQADSLPRKPYSYYWFFFFFFSYARSIHSWLLCF